MEPLKHRINTHTVQQAGGHLQRAWPAFDRQRFESLAGDGLDALELKARALRLADALQATLPSRFAAAAEVLEFALAPPLPLDADGEPLALTDATAEQGLAGWVVWSLGEWVVRAGRDDVPRALACLHALTQRFTAEFALRPFVRDHPAQVFETLRRWTLDPSAHVRRLVSEGTRPRLPWGLRLQALVADPTPTLPLLCALQDDASAYVRRSVANHLNDIAKDHPLWVSDWVRAHRPGADTRRTALLRHASRTLIRQGHGPTLQAWGLQTPLQGRATLALSSQQARMGETLQWHVALESTSARPQDLVVDFVLHHPRGAGRTSVRVFKGWTLTLGAAQARTLVKNHRLRPATTRALHPGLHRVVLQINGQALAEAAFDLRGPMDSAR